MREAWLIRHAETEWTKSRQHTGVTDIPLTEAGREAARALAPRLAGHEFALVLVSPLSRARVTAELAGFGNVAQVREELREWDYGDYEGVTTQDIRAKRPGWYLWRDGAPNGETADDVGARVDPVIAEIDAVDGDVAIFAHGHLLRALGARWVGEHASFGGRLALDPGTISRLGYEREVRVLRAWNG
jgi:probable phosphoglycerate mutase